MKRGNGPKRNKPLKADPEKVREFLKRQKPLQRSKLARGGSAPGRAKRPSGARERGALTAIECRREVWRLDGGKCVNCGRSVPRDADFWVWSPHHPLPQQWMKRNGLSRLIWDPRFCMTACSKCHADHEGPNYSIPGEKIPQRTREAILGIGVRAAAVLERLHPSAHGAETDR